MHTKETLFNKPYTWGKINYIHEIGEYLIVEYYPDKFTGGYHEKGKYEDYLNYHPYINGKDINQSFISLDHALVGIIAYKYDGCNSRAAEYFMKAIKPAT